MTHGQFYRTLRLIGEGVTHTPMIAEAWQHWSAVEPEARLDQVAGNGCDPRDSERVRVWNAGWDGGMEQVLYHVEDLERQVKALELRLTCFVDALTGDDDPSLWRLTYLDQLLANYRFEHDPNADADVDATEEALALIDSCLHDLRDLVPGEERAHPWRA